MPTFTDINGHDHKAFILSVNINRRHLNSGQRAVATAIIHPEVYSVKSSGKPDDLKLGHWKNLLSQARTVLKDSRALAEQVLSGKVFLDAAYREAKARLDEKRSSDAKMSDLQTGAPDLAKLVLESRVTLDEALAQLEHRKPPSPSTVNARPHRQA